MIGGREAIPIRALPYVTGWSMSPDVVAKKLAQNEHWTVVPMNINAFLKIDNNYRLLVPKEWDGIVAELSECADKSEKNDESYASWRRESLPILPANCFVWKNDFENAYNLSYSPKALTIVGERECERDLNFSPLIPSDSIAMVMEGFENETEANIVTKQSNHEKPWLIHNSLDPEPKNLWYTPARYFARELLKEDPLLLSKRKILATKVSDLLTKYKIYKRGGSGRFNSDTILKAFSNIDFG